MSRDTIPPGRRVVVHQYLPQKLIVRGRTLIVYDMELTLMVIKDWAARGSTRTEIEDILISALGSPPRLIQHN